MWKFNQKQIVKFYDQRLRISTITTWKFNWTAVLNPSSLNGNPNLVFSFNAMLHAGYRGS